MRSAESAGSVSIFDGPLGAVTTVTASAVDESTRDRATAARRTRMGTPSGKIRWQGMDSGTPGQGENGPRRAQGLLGARAGGQRVAQEAEGRRAARNRLAPAPLSARRAPGR